MQFTQRLQDVVSSALVKKHGTAFLNTNLTCMLSMQHWLIGCSSSYALFGKYLIFKCSVYTPALQLSVLIDM